MKKRVWYLHYCRNMSTLMPKHVYNKNLYRIFEIFNFYRYNIISSNPNAASYISFLPILRSISDLLVLQLELSISFSLNTRFRYKRERSSPSSRSFSHFEIQNCLVDVTVIFTIRLERHKIAFLNRNLHVWHIFTKYLTLQNDYCQEILFCISKF